MPVVPVQDVLAYRLAVEVPDLRPPAALLQRLSDVLGEEEVLLLTTDLRPLGFGAYAGQLCLVTATRVLLATAGAGTGEAAFTLEQWAREVPARPATPVPPRAPAHGS